MPKWPRRQRNRQATERLAMSEGQRRASTMDLDRFGRGGAADTGPRLAIEMYDPPTRSTEGAEIGPMDRSPDAVTIPPYPLYAPPERANVMDFSDYQPTEVALTAEETAPPEDAPSPREAPSISQDRYNAARVFMDRGAPLGTRPAVGVIPAAMIMDRPGTDERGNPLIGIDIKHLDTEEQLALWSQLEPEEQQHLMESWAMQTGIDLESL